MVTRKFTDVLPLQDHDGLVQKKKSHAPEGELFRVVGERNGKKVLRRVRHNVVVVGGAITALEAITTGTASWKPATLNDIHGIPATASGPIKLMLFGAGTGGANLSIGSIVNPDIKQRDVIDPVPMRYATGAISGDDAGKYFMRKEDSANPGYFSYYLKTVTGVGIKSAWDDSIIEDEDGTEITSEIYNSTRLDGIETFADITITLNTSDIREYFVTTSEISLAKYNTFGFYTGSLNEAGTEYADVRLYAVITFDNESLRVPTESEYVYRMHSLI